MEVNAGGGRALFFFLLLSFFPTPQTGLPACSHRRQAVFPDWGLKLYSAQDGSPPGG